MVALYVCSIWEYLHGGFRMGILGLFVSACVGCIFSLDEVGDNI